MRTNKKSRFLFVVGTRPEVIKMAPLILQFRKEKKYKAILLNTQQQKELSDKTLKFFKLKSDINFNVMTPDQTLLDLQSKLLLKFQNLFSKVNNFDGVFVQGDTMSAFCAGLSAFYHHIPVFHVEAGLRSYNLGEPFPEEALRQMLTRISSLHFAPTQRAYDALLKENVDKKNIAITGNTVVDALGCIAKDAVAAARKNIAKEKIDIDKQNIVLITVHRRENHGKRLIQILNAIKVLANKFSGFVFVVPVHPNPNVKDKVYQSLSNIKNIKLIQPLNYPSLALLAKNAHLILTDSGGIQEEAPTFGLPTLVARYETERKEAIEAGVSKLVGADEKKIILEASKILAKSRAETRIKVANPYGDGRASQKILKRVKAFFDDK